MIALLLPAFFALQGQPPPTSTSVGAAATAAIRGRVLRNDGRPLPRVTVVARPTAMGAQPPTERRPFGQWAAQTDEDGRFEIADVPVGQVTVTATKTGYMSAAFAQMRPGVRPLALAPGEVREDVDITLVRLSAITGRVVDDYGDPVEGAAIRVFQIRFAEGRRRLVETSSMLGMRRSDDRGRYRIFSLAPGRYIVSASVGQVTLGAMATDLPGYAPTYFPGTANPSEAQFVTVSLGEDVPNVDIALARTATARITGQALSADGDPITGGLTLVASHRSGALVATPVGARIDPDGTFEFPNVAPGEYVLQAYKNRSGPSVEGEFACQLITVNGADVTDVALRASRGSTISGHVVLDGAGAPRMSDVDLIAAQADPDLTPPGSPASAAIRDDWTFTMAGINGPRRLRLARAPAGWMLKSISLKGTDVTDALMSFGTSEQSIPDLEVVLTDRVTRLTATIDGLVNRPVGGPVQIIAFAVDRERWYPGSRYVAASWTGSGTFVFSALPPGDYYVAARIPLAAPDDGGWEDPDVLESLVAGAARAVLTDGQQASVSVTLGRR